MSSAPNTAEARLHYSQHLAKYTERQFNFALASLDSEKIAGLSKIPSAHSCVSQRAAQICTNVAPAASISPDSDVRVKA